MCRIAIRAILDRIESDGYRTAIDGGLDPTVDNFSQRTFELVPVLCINALFAKTNN
jgi:hypothetical protein